MSPLGGGWSVSELAGMVTHVGVLSLGVGGLLGLESLPRGRRSGVGLVLMALAMALLIAWPRWRFGPELATAAGHVGLFCVGLWLLIGPVRR